jgi:hypothetical protein
MEPYDTSLYHPVDLERPSNYKIVNQIGVREGSRDFKNNCTLSQQTPDISKSQNVVWGSQKLLQESCPNNASIETPSHYAWNNFTKRITIVE